MLKRKFTLCLASLMVQLTACNNISASSYASFKSFYCQGNSNFEKLRCQLAEAQKSHNYEKVEQLAQEFKNLLGTQAGIPETPTEFRQVSLSSRQLRSDEIPKAFTPYMRKIRKETWLFSEPEPLELRHPLRLVASVITGTLAARRAGSENSEQLLKIAEKAGNYLLLAQKQGGKGLFPFPAAKGRKAKPFQVAEQFLNYIEGSGRLSEAVVNGWIVNDLGIGDGGLQFDNGLCGVAMLELYEATKKTQYLQAALKAADWAMLHPVVPNWNYNSFSVFLLSYAYGVTGDVRYLESAKEKTRLGIYPGLLTTGPYKGRWADPHNAVMVYHYVIIQGLGALVAVLPDNDPDLPQAVNTLSLALRVRNKEILEKGVSSPDIILEVLSRLQLSLPSSSGRLSNEGCTAVLDLIGRYATKEFLSGNLPVLPSSWGLFLEALN
jgi:hypothetical protein